MNTLGELAKLIRSKNAGPFFLTFDVMFESEEQYTRVAKSQALSAERIADIYGAELDAVEVYHYAPALAIKVTIPRPIPSCDVGDTDTHGGQQFAPLVDMEID